MKTYIYIDNFRGFSEALIPLDQVNFLVGENSTGKTSFIELLGAFSNAHFWLFEPVYGEPGMQQKHFLDLVSASSASKNEFSIGAIGMTSEGRSSEYGMIVTYVNIDGRPEPQKVSLIYDRTVTTVEGHLWKEGKQITYSHRTQTCTAKSSTISCTDELRHLVAAHKSSAGFTKKRVAAQNTAAPLFYRFDELRSLGESISKRTTRVLRMAKVPFPFGPHFVDIAPIRTRPRRTYDAPQTEFSPEGKHTPYVIKKLLSSKSQADTFKSYLDQAGESSGLFESVSVKQYGKGPRSPFELAITLGETALGLESVGYGVSQALPVLVEMFARPKNTTITIQQPEVHLHPRAQATFGDLIAQLARVENKTFIVETHSDFTIDRFRLNVRKNGAVPSQVLFFERTAQGNTATSISITENGDLSPDQPDAYRNFFFNESISLLS